MNELFVKKFRTICNKNQSPICVGLDTDYERIPECLKKGKSKEEAIFEFNKEIIKETFDLVCGYKPNIAFYEAFGLSGIKALMKTIKFLKKKFADIPIILDAKKNDIGTTLTMVANFFFKILDVDGVTLNPYLGFDSLEPFFQYKNKYNFVLCKTSNPSSKDFQDLELSGRKLYEIIASKISEWNKIYANVGLVVGATYPQVIKDIRKIVGDEIIFLIPGFGTQGGKPRDINSLINFKKPNLIMNVSRSVIYASNEKDFALRSRQELKKILSILKF